MKTVRVHAGKPYDAVLGQGLLEQAGALAARAIPACKVALITDENVAPLYLNAARLSLAGAGYEVHSLILPPGEGTKRWTTLERILEFLAGHAFTRADAVAALGGGVIGDAAGFAAAVYLRGVALVQLPTTLLAAVDASVGGKTAVNLAAGKNLAGAFHQPVLVVCDTDTLSTLSPESYAGGVAEVVKYGMLGDPALLELLAGGLRDAAPDLLEDVIARCVQMKAQLVARDELDRGPRQLLNLGHTLGHAVEALSDFSIGHGQAVAMGMVCMARAAWRRGLSRENCAPVLAQVLAVNGLPTACPYGAQELARAALSDKKRRGDRVTLVLPERVGSCLLHPLPVDRLEDFIREGLDDDQ